MAVAAGLVVADTDVAAEEADASAAHGLDREVVDNEDALLKEVRNAIHEKAGE